MRILADVYPDSTHVRDIGLESADDQVIWAYARDTGLTRASKDADFRQRSFLYGAPPKVIWIRLGTCSTRDVEAILRTFYSDLHLFEQDIDASFLAIG